ncbi:HNH endonuclease family protein [Nonomuraea salmonea]|uniref:HNH endonuclease family protein n=1 Tax=Nonomuraea salmonea TaxID=46181 RepID=A0ABV5P2M7_9ACTN
MPATVQVAFRRLDGLTVRAETNDARYTRDAFPHWSSHGHGCDTRELVLIREGRGRDGDGPAVETGPGCRPLKGSWWSPYDGATWTEPGDVDIDHMVPLKEAWRSGAAGWSVERRRAFANDLDVSPQLWAVTDNVNASKADSDPAEWRPPRTEFWCRYAKAWVEVKARWELAAQQEEVEALREMLGTCGADQ